jgi:NAD(P)H-flavin reductase
VYDKTIPFEARIRWVKKETRDTATYAVKILDRDIQKTFRFLPGQFNMLSVPGIGESAISISSEPSDHELLHTIRVAGDVTAAIADMKPGDVVGVRGPFGAGWPLEEAEGRDVMIIAGGLGIAPLRSLIRRIYKAFHAGKTFGKGSRPNLLYGAKTPKDVIFRDEFPRYRDAFEVFLTVDRADPEVYWRGETGLVTKLLSRISFNPLNTVTFMCGPEIMMRNTAEDLVTMGIPGEKIFLSMERNMNCGIGICGHCMFGPKFVCKDGPVFRFSDVEQFISIKEL